ncbi:MAG: peptide chain release factor N(5)-glutamine methyltransferase [Gammaproteobacteria bacterium]|nr:MAG: peptide chain release factor N(5)-glutamine methyltransferase [Gammaproteobacteria bacterium]
MNHCIKETLDLAVVKLQNSDQARLEAEVLLAHVLNKPRTYLHAWPESELSEEQALRFGNFVEQRAAGRPVAYLTGHREFWSLDLEVTVDTLIPRPETELLVEQALALLPAHKNLQVTDLGTGSGAIAIALAQERKPWTLCALDRSLSCTRVAQRNAGRLGIHNISFVNASWCDALADASCHAIVCNPPYVADQDPHLQQGDVRFEPISALASGTDGLDDIRKLVAGAARVLKTGGWILLEHGFNQSETIRNLLNTNKFINIETLRDLAGLERVSYAQKPA